jgi:DNA-binding IscR family transcriptional regulator
MEVGCALQETWAEVRDATIAILDRTTFADLATRSGGRWVSSSVG